MCESAAGAGEANRGKKRPREEKAPAALEEHAAGAAEGGQSKRKAEAEGGPQKAKRQRTVPRKRKRYER